MKTHRTAGFSFLFGLLGLVSLSAMAASHWPQNVLITNDNGIDDPKIWALAKAVAKDSDTWIVAASKDRSGSSNYMTLGADRRALTVHRVFQQGHLTAYSFDGYPADCVAFGILGPMKHQAPDLVISGINGGPNLGQSSWFGSGTIGAARTAAHMGIPAIAVSGLHDKDTAMVNAVTHWLVAFIHSPMVQQLQPGQYLTIAFPRVAVDKIHGVVVAPKTPPTPHLAEFERVDSSGSGSDVTEVWLAKPTGKKPQITADGDQALYRQNDIVITPMQIGEQNPAALSQFRGELAKVPPWPKAKP
ncbi:5'/3'-nucleotidase SurE [Gallaecimonas mangrovi]|uniref:5'/3'-nucleotidase SurE n=1 Tax=Gallaecimonas mangrovi TaxID=2291597 RepID=UPI000E206B47|nr:5'/3'-nucleotidase SurE [Gallaecimonas mangrovi]